MLEYLKDSHCTGCFACVQKCPKQCIDIIKDSEGFYIPKINTENCIHCGLCQKVCPQINQIELHEAPTVYAAKMKDAEVLKKSTSGGMFAIMALHILGQGGVVYGVEMTPEGVVQTVGIEKAEELTRLQGSKYVQAHVGNSYMQAKKQLDGGRTVLFSGTPCQIAGLYKFLGKDYANLYTMDLVCHGVPSQELYSAYRSWMEEKNGQKMLAWNFRDKDCGGWELVNKLVFEKKEMTQRQFLDPYTCAFLQGNTYRESCYACHYSQGNRVGDLSMGDYWGIRKWHPEVYYQDGVSVLLVNSDKGKQLLDSVKEELLLVESKLEWAQEANGNLKQPSKRPAKRDRIYYNFHTKPMEEFVKTDLKIKLDKKFHLAEILKHYIPYEKRQNLKAALKKIKVRK